MSYHQQFQSLTKEANNIVITTHLHPDADGIGSQIALCMALRKLGKNAVCVNEEPLLERYSYLDPDGCIISAEEYLKKPLPIVDLFVVVDTNSLPRIGGNLQQTVQKSKNLLFIDHHPCPKEMIPLHCIDTSMAATGELVGALIESVNVPFDQVIALALYTAILIDTSSFRYPTVTAATHRLIAKLMDTGINPPQAYNNIYGTKKVTYMKMLGTILSKTQTTEDEKVAWISLDEDILEKFMIDPEDTHGFINNLLILDNIKVACMFRQIGDSVKISFRSAGDIDVGIMAQALGGGGHNHSAATMIIGTLDEVVPRTITKIQLMLSNVT
jgi:bifunctional oligoribonuclease and PAP phosphatase NrnA